MKYDIVVIGGGTAGYVAGSILARKGKKVLVIEKEKFGGVCVNFGCVPSIFLFDVTFLLNRFKEIAYYLGLDGKIEYKDLLFSKRNEIINYLSNAGRRLIEDSGGETELGEAEIISRSEVKVNGRIVEFDKLIIATGSKPLIPNIDGIEDAISEDDAVNLNSIPSSMVVIGGGYAGVEIAQIYSRLGSQVTLLSRSEILPTFPEDIRSVVKDSLEFDGVNVVENTRIVKLRDGKVITEKGEIEGNLIVYATGRRPQLPKGIEKLGLEINECGIIVDKYKQIRDNVYAIGDVIDKERKTAHSAMFDALVASLHILKETTFIPPDNFKIPVVLYTDPQVGVIGDHKEAKKFSVFPFAATTRAIINGIKDGYVKIGINERNEIVFGEVIGDKAEDLINILTLVVNNRMRIESLALMPFVHPSLSEAIVNAAKGFFDLDVDRYKSKDGKT
ncbi:MAG: NAD(P)/FAD-dependent oxidoreductase [Saccharolobus sp.]|uniref:dihydrolipoyl dehydrogenase family protein n=1 Tax=Saccharolobus TaxID=2100760 RepID=UPI001F116927|nr:NAD(P)/FAD-dependent oxidoreductase [Saccharolobus shibatae]MCH4816013.1 NAD(P)/FAD-dependent oxidoreductase [Saccharolobus shibatae]